jgi:hypothetical protein
MSLTSEVVRENGLNREVWAFRLVEDALVLFSYRKESKPSNRARKWRTQAGYVQFGSRPHQEIRLKDVPLPCSVRFEAVDNLIRKIHVRLI